MLINKIKQLKSGRHERGNDIVTTVLLLPIMVFLLFTMIDVSYYFQARSIVQSTAQDGARMVALYGGEGTNKNVPLNPSTKTVAEQMKNRLWNAEKGTCIPSACKKSQTVVVTCGPKGAIKSGLNTEVWCEVKYPFHAPSVGMASALGFGGLFGEPITVKAVSLAETYYGDR